MYNISEKSIGSAWFELVKLVENHGTNLADEGKEITDIRISFQSAEQDPIIESFANQDMLESMKSVFFGQGENKLGHNYKDLTRGPLGKNDLTDVIELLQEKEQCKRATLTLCGNGSGKVPCINVINFLIRDNQLDVYYFSRGQDTFKKFYADANCISSMQNFVAKSMSVTCGTITGYIASAHSYFEDQTAIDHFLNSAISE